MWARLPCDLTPSILPCHDFSIQFMQTRHYSDLMNKLFPNLAQQEEYFEHTMNLDATTPYTE